MNAKRIGAIFNGMNTRRLWLFVVVMCFLFNIGVVGAQTVTCETDTDYSTEGDALAASGDHAAAVDAYYCALAQNPLDVDVLLHRAESAILSERYLDSWAPYGTLAFFPDTLPARVEALRAQVAAEPDNLEAWILLTSADFYTEEGAQADIDALLQSAPDNAYANLLNAHWLALNGDFDAARPFFERTLELAPDNAHILGWMASEYDLYGETDAALSAEAVQRALALDPNDYSIIVSYAYALGNIDVNAADAEVVLDHFTTLLPPGIRLTYMIRANAFLSMGDADKGAEEVARFVADHPGMLVDGGSISAEQPVSGEMTFGRVIEYQFEANAGDTVSLRAEDIDGAVDTMVAALAPDGSGLALNDDADPVNGDFNGEVMFTAPVDGTYTLFITHAGGGSEGNLEVTVSVE